MTINNLYFSMILLTPKQMIDKLKEFDGIVLGALSLNKIIGLSNDFYTKPIIDKVKEDLPNLKFCYKPITKDRTLWLITCKELEIFKDNKTLK